MAIKSKQHKHRNPGRPKAQAALMVQNTSRTYRKAKAETSVKNKLTEQIQIKLLNTS